jgi:hypothetical protein
VSDQKADPLAMLHQTPDERLEALLLSLEGLPLETLPGSGVKLSKFTLKQMSRKVKPVPEDSKRSGLRLKAKRPRQHYQTRRKQWRKENKTKTSQFHSHRHSKGDLWEISKEDWEVLWDFVGGRSYTLKRYSKADAYRMDTVYAYDNKTKEKLWEGYDDKLRQLGMCI